MNCPHCGVSYAKLKNIGDYIPPTCGKSECQEAEFKANQLRNKPKSRKRLRPKEGALKADGTRWTSQPGGVQKLELEVPTLSSNEYLFAVLVTELAGHVKLDYSLLTQLTDVMGGYEASEVLDRAEAVIARVKRHRG
jgi:uncharacterized Zn finger protein (UPF0148 family)